MTLFQLRRIGLPPSLECIKNTYKLHGDIYIGRGKSADVFLDSNIRKGLISRTHARISKQTVSTGEVVYEIFDTSLNGTYINDVRINQSQILEEGDKIAFGHLRGAIIDPGEYAPQKDSEFIFEFEKVTKDDMVDETDVESSIFMSLNSIDKEQILPGVLHTQTFLERAHVKESDKKPLHNRTLNTTTDKDDAELSSIISNVTSKILNDADSQHNDSFNLEVPLQNKLDDELTEDQPPFSYLNKGKCVLDQIKRCKSPENSSIISGSDHDIKRDTSLSITHVYEDIEPQFLSDALRSKVRQVFRDHDTKRTIQNHVLDKIQIPIDDQEDDVESIFSDKSEEIPDSGSDSEFTPAKSDSSDSGSRTRTRQVKIPSRFSPQQTEKKQKLNPKSVHIRRLPSKLKKPNNKMRKFTHDKCAAWDCVLPSGSLKQIMWVACDDCDEWYHVSCSGLSAKDAMQSKNRYHCGCS